MRNKRYILTLLLLAIEAAPDDPWTHNRLHELYEYIDAQPDTISMQVAAPEEELEP